MPRVSEIRTNFSAGELSQLINSRTRFERYFNGSETLENFVVRTQGAITRRKGFRFIAETKDSTKESRLIPFEFSTIQTYIIEIGEGYLRFFSNQGRVLDGSSQILEVINPYLESELVDLKFIQDSDVLYITHPNHPIYKLIRLSINSFSFNPIELFKGPYIDENIISTDLLTISGGSPWSEGSSLTLTATGGHTPFSSDIVGSLWKVRSGEDIAHLKITSFTSSTIVIVEAKNNIPASLQNIPSFNWAEGEFSNKRGYPSAITFHEQRLVLSGAIKNPQRIWFSKTNGDYENFEAGNTSADPFKITIASQKGDPIRWLFTDQVLFVGTSGSIFRITNSRNSSAVSIDDVDVKKHIAYGSSSIQPELVGQAPVYMQKNNKIARLISFDVDSDKYKATDIVIDADHITGAGIKYFDFQQIPTSSLWAIRKDGEVAILTLEQDQDIKAWGRYKTQGEFESVAIISSPTEEDEIYCIVKRDIDGVEKRFIEIQEPNYEVDNLNRFYVDSGLTYDGRRQANLTLSSAISSFAIIDESGFLLVDNLNNLIVSNPTDITITSDVGVFNSNDVGNQINEIVPFGKGKAIIKSFIDANNITVEIIEDFSNSNLLINQWAIAIKQITGLEHLNNMQVSISSDGATTPIQTVKNGSLNIDIAGSIIHSGLSYKSIQKNMPIEATALLGAIGTSQHKDKRIDNLVIRFSDTLGGKIIDNDNIETPILARRFSDNMNEAPPLTNGDEEITVATGWDKLGQISIIQEDPQPMTVKSITYKVSVNDK